MKEFKFKPAEFIPFRDVKELERIRNIKREDMDKHPNPDFKIQIVPDDYLEFIMVTDMFKRIKDASDRGEKVVFILPNPAPQYKKVAYLINKFRVNCKDMHVFIMDEWADQDGNIAPENYPQGFMHACKKFLYSEIDEDLRPKESQIVGPTNENINDYSKMIEDMGGADACYSGPGWTGHIAFVDPDVPEFDVPLDEWKQLGARVTTLNPFTVAQNSLHGSFGASGDMANVPPKAATIGPKDALGAKFRMDMHGITTMGTFVTWQRIATRLSLHGPVTPKIPTSILQTVPTDVYVTETLAANIEPRWDIQY